MLNFLFRFSNIRPSSTIPRDSNFFAYVDRTVFLPLTSFRPAGDPSNIGRAVNHAALLAVIVAKLLHALTAPLLPPVFPYTYCRSSLLIDGCRSRRSPFCSAVLARALVVPILAAVWSSVSPRQCLSTTAVLWSAVRCDKARRMASRRSSSSTTQNSSSAAGSSTTSSKRRASPSLSTSRGASREIGRASGTVKG